MAALAAPGLASAGWEQVGPAVNEGATDQTHTATSSLAGFAGTPYVAWYDVAYGANEGRAGLGQFNGSEWAPQTFRHTGGYFGAGPSLANVNGVPHVAWTEKTDQQNGSFDLWVKRLVGGIWEPVGAGPLNVNAAGQTDAYGPEITSVDGTPCVTWWEYNSSRGGNEVYAKCFMQGAWLSAGGALNEENAHGVNPTITSIGGRPWVAWYEEVGRIRVARYEPQSNTWTPVGTGSVNGDATTGTRLELSLTHIGSTAYLAWEETGDEAGGFVKQIRVSRFAGAAWSVVAPGSPINDPARSSVDPSLAAVDGVLHVAYTEDDGNATTTTVRVKRLSAGGNSWEAVGSALPKHSLTSSTSLPSLADVGGLPHVSYTDRDGSAEVRVARFVRSILNTARPKLTGTPSLGSTLSCSQGTWSGEPSDFTYVWERAAREITADDDPAWGAINGASGPQYAVQQNDVGSRVRCRVIASSPGDSAEAVSASLRADVGPPQSVSPPLVKGAPVAGQTLTCEPGTWNTGVDLKYQWYTDSNAHTLGKTEIEGETKATYKVRGHTPAVRGDAGNDIGCLVTGTNDIGSATAVSEPVLAVNGPPLGERKPEIHPRDDGSANPAGQLLGCSPGRWQDDYAARGIAGYPYEWAWLRNGQVIAGQVGHQYVTTPDDLGKAIRCRVTAANPAGRGTPMESAEYLVPLPKVASRGRMLVAQGKNEFVPTNLLAIGKEYDSAVQNYAFARLSEALKADEARCHRFWKPDRSNVGTKPLLLDLARTPFSPALRCRIYWHDRARVQVRSDGIWYVTYQAVGERITPGTYKEHDMGFGLPPVDPRKPLPIDPQIQASLGGVTPVRIIWDVDDDGRTDATCPAAAPVLRSLLKRGQWDPRAIVVYPDSAETGVYSEARAQGGVANPRLFSNLPKGVKRAGQPFMCRTSLEQPPEPQLGPCVTEGTMGKVRVTGNLCPINVRSMEPSEIQFIRTNNPSLYTLLDKMSDQLDDERQGARAASRPMAPPDAIPELLPRAFLDPDTSKVGSTLANTASSYAGFKPDRALPPGLEPPPIPDAVAKAVPNLKVAAGQFAMEQMYIAKGPMKVNGVSVNPLNGDSALFVPSDVGEGLSTVKNMQIAIGSAEKKLGSLVLEEAGPINAVFDDKVGETKAQLIKGSLDALRNAASKLKFGPFKFSGAMDVKLENDGTATLYATASIPFLTGSPGGGGLTANATLRGDREGNISLQGFTLRASDAYMGFMRIKDLFLRYENGITVQGKIIFPVPPSNPTLTIHNFQLGPGGEFKKLDVEYAQSPGLLVGPGVFLTSARGGWNNDDKILNVGASVSVGPGVAGGCPTLGIKADFRIQFARVVTFDGEGPVVLACIPLVKLKVHADTTGYVSAEAGFDLSEGPFFINAKLAGSIKLPHWQIEFSGAGGIRDIPVIGSISAELKAVLGDRGLAACASIKILFARVAAGAGVRFSGGRPPLSYPELLANLRLFTGCDLSSWKSLPPLARAAQDGGGTAFRVPEGGRGIGVAFEGAGEAPRVRLRSPSGKVYDFSGAQKGTTIQNAFGLIVDEEDRTVVLIEKPEAGRWTAETAEGSPAIARMERSDILPPAKMTGTVGGVGSSRILRYRIPRIEGQVVRIVEEANGAQKELRTVRGGGDGTVRFETSEAKGTRRRIVAQITQDGMPRENIDVARFSAPSPRVGRATNVRVRRRGRSAVVTWRPAPAAVSYDVQVTSGDGQKTLLSPKGRALRVTVPGVTKGEGVAVRVVGISRAGRRGPAAPARLKGSLRLGAKKPVKPRRGRARRG